MKQLKLLVKTYKTMHNMQRRVVKYQRHPDD